MSLSDDELRARLLRLGDDPGPITATTRSVYTSRLKRLEKCCPQSPPPNGSPTRRRSVRRRTPSPPPPARSVRRRTPSPPPHARPVRRRTPSPPPPVRSPSRSRTNGRETSSHLSNGSEPNTSSRTPSSNGRYSSRPAVQPVSAASTSSGLRDVGSAWRDGLVSTSTPLAAGDCTVDGRSSIRTRMFGGARSAAARRDEFDTGSDSERDEWRGAGSSDQLRRFRGRTSVAVPRATPSGHRVATVAPAEGRSWRAHVPLVLVLLAVLFFCALVGYYMRLKPSVEEINGDVLPSTVDVAPDVFPICGGPAVQLRWGCVPAERLERAAAMLESVHAALTSAARDAGCGQRSDARLSLTELSQQLQLPDTAESRQQLRDLSVLVAYNGDWGLATDMDVVLESSGTDPRLWALDVTTPWSCVVSCWFWYGVNIAVYSLMAAATVWLLLAGWRFQQRRRQRQQRRMYSLVERIVETISQHAASDGQPIAVSHVRDQLIPLHERTQPHHRQLWQQAVQFLRDNESRVREERVLVSGEQYAVWRWLPPAGPARSPTPRRVWLGQAFPTGSGMNAPHHARTPCLKIRNMFLSNAADRGVDWQQEVRDALLEKCEGIGVVHVSLDAASRDGLVYVKCVNADAALLAFRRVQGCWFDGLLVSVKFITLQRYHERFPESQQALTPLMPSNTLKRSLACLSSVVDEDL